MRIFRNSKLLFVSGILFAACALILLAQEGTEPSTGNEPKISLQIVACVGEPGTTLAFVAKNDGTNDFVTTPICRQHNFIWFTKPNGKRAGITIWGFRDLPPVVIKPSETKTWKVDLKEWDDFKMPGMYKVRWSLERIESIDFVLLKGSEAGE